MAQEKENFVCNWNEKDVKEWLCRIGFEQYVEVFRKHEVDGMILQRITEKDLSKHFGITSFKDVKKLAFHIENIKPEKSQNIFNDKVERKPSNQQFQEDEDFGKKQLVWTKECDKNSFSKLIFSSIWLISVCFITALTMAVVHDRVPNQQFFKPLPDIFLDNVAIIPFAFKLVEMIIFVMSLYFSSILIFHKHRLIILRRFCAICATVFLFRCATMFITSLSVPNESFVCNANYDSKLEDKLRRAWLIFINLGLSVNGVRSCGDYIFSGHSSMLTLFCLFCIEYTPSGWKGVETVIRALNFVGMFFVLASHEHYSIDVILAYFISSRLFYYYHSLANTKGLKIKHTKTGEYFPFFNYFEEHTSAIVPNEFSVPFQSFLWQKKESK